MAEEKPKPEMASEEIVRKRAAALLKAERYEDLAALAIGFGATIIIVAMF